MNSLYQSLKVSLANNIDDIALQLGLEKKSLEMIKYSMLPPGKLVRPIIGINILKDITNSNDIKQNILDLFLGLEFIHVSTLIHDDLPSLDNDDQRRGKATAHKCFGEGNSVLLGALLSGIGITWPKFFIEKETAGIISSEWASSYAVVQDGQILDIDNSRTAESLERLYAKKTGALFKAAFTAAAIIAKLENTKASALGKLGEAVGIYFQILNDKQDAAGVGRSGGSDNKNGRLTWGIDKNGNEINLESYICEAESVLNFRLENLREVVKSLKLAAFLT